MPYESLAEFLEELEGEGELARVRTEVDPILEVSEITDRISKAHGPALLFEKVRGSRYPLAINVLGSERRMAKALGVKDLDEMAQRIAEIDRIATSESVQVLPTGEADRVFLGESPRVSIEVPVSSE